LESEHKIWLIGGSAGSIKACISILKAITKPMDRTLIMILHRGNDYKSELAEIFSNATGHTVMDIGHQTKLEKGVYIAPQDYHLLLDETFNTCLELSEKVNYSRPSIDVTFESFSYILKDSLNVAILSGSNADGAFGVSKVLQRGGRAIVIHPEDAEFKTMPSETIKQNEGKCSVLKINELIQCIKKENT